MVQTPKLGGAIGGRIAGLVAATVPAVRAKSAKTVVDTAMATQHKFFALVSHEQRATTGRIFAELAKHPESPDWAKRTFGFLAHGSGQWQTFLAQTAAGNAISVGLTDLINNSLGRAIGAIIAQTPNGFPSIADLANMVARRRQPFEKAEYGARAQGMRTQDFANLVHMNFQPTPPGDVLTLFNRGEISRSTAESLLGVAGLSFPSVDRAMKLARRHLSPEQAAELENFGVISRSQGRNIASMSGVTRGDYDRLALGGGVSPPLEVLYEAFRRGVINRGRFNKGVQQGPIRNEWFDVIRALRFRNTPVSMALSAATQNLIPETRARRIWAEEGLIPGDFDWAIESNGLPLGISQAADLFNRGKITRSFARQMFLESNIKNKYVDLIFPLFERVPPMEQTIMLVREGVLTTKQGVRGLRDLGFTAQRAGQLVELAITQKNAPDRNLSISTVQELYESQILSGDEAREKLVSLGFTRTEAEWQLSIRDMRRQRSRLNSAVNRVRSRFVAGRIDQREAETALDALELRAAARDDFIDTWAIERDISRPQLTTSQIQQAMRAGLISLDAGFTRLVEAGYDEADAGILTQLAAPRQ